MKRMMRRKTTGENIINKARHKRMIIYALSIILPVILIVLIHFVIKEKEWRRITDEQYTIACDYLDGREYPEAVAAFDEIKGYKDADALRAYADVSYKVIHFVESEREFEEPEVLRNELKAIPDNYSGRYKEKILKLKQYMENEYEDDYKEYLKYKAGICIRDNCDNPVEGSFCFCKEHKCHVKECKYGAIEGRLYCARHPKGQGDLHSPSGKNSTTTNTASPKRQSSYSNSSSNSKLDVSDVDVEGFYYDHRGEFSSMDDAEDYLDDYPEEWDE